MRILILIALIAASNKCLAQTVSTTSPITIGEKISFFSGILQEPRSVNVYLPPEYADNDTAHFPVVYLLDGGIDEDFLHVAGLYQFNSFPWVARVKPSIIVGIVNVDRMRDMTFPTDDSLQKATYPASGRSARFIEFLGKELQPLIEKKYRTNSQKTLIGESLAGLLATEILLKTPLLFSKYVIVSPSLWWNNGSLLQFPLVFPNRRDHLSTSVFIAVGKEGLTPGPNPRVMEVDARLLAEKIKSIKSKSVSVRFDYLPDEDHATILHHAIYDFLAKDCDCQ